MVTSAFQHHFCTHRIININNTYHRTTHKTSAFRMMSSTTEEGVGGVGLPPPTTAKKTFNVAIVGGGITGSCAASIFTSFNNQSTSSTSLSLSGATNTKRIEPYINSLVLQELVGKTCTTNDKNDGHHDPTTPLFQVNVDLFDQGRSGVGGRTSHRRRNIIPNNKSSNDNNDDKNNIKLRWDHGCQFFRADTTQFQKVVHNWMAKDMDLVQEWKGQFVSNSKNKDDDNNEFFGLPSKPPFYVGSDGMQSISKGLLDHLQQHDQHQTIDEDTKQPKETSLLNIFTGTRVAKVDRDPISKKWFLYGLDGTSAYHDTTEQKVKELQQPHVKLGSLKPTEEEGYDAVLLTDVSSSSFGTWHRASANVPDEFATKVRERVGARVPLFTAMIAFDSKETNISFDAASFHPHDNDIENSTIWFASKMNSKPMKDSSSNPPLEKECWTIVSTPEYAMRKIEETPMQTKDGEFIPQSKDYLTTIPGPELQKAFIHEITSKDGILGDKALSVEELPEIVYLDAQRWGSAMPSHRHLDESSKTRKIISNVPYDSGRGSLAPTKLESSPKGRSNSDGNDSCDDYDGGISSSSTTTFLCDEDLMLFQAGDMMSTYTPGFEGAAISGIDAAEKILITLSK